MNPKKIENLINLQKTLETVNKLSVKTALDRANLSVKEVNDLKKDFETLVGMFGELKGEVKSIPLDKEISNLTEKISQQITKVVNDVEKKDLALEKKITKSIKKDLAELKKDVLENVKSETIVQEFETLIEKEVNIKEIARGLNEMSEIETRAVKGLDEKISSIEDGYRDGDEAIKKELDRVRGSIGKSRSGSGSSGLQYISQDGIKVAQGVDTIDFTGADVTKTVNGVKVSINGSGSSTFLGLTDTPSLYSGQALKFARVNAGETALEFATPSGSGNVSTTTIADNSLVRGDGGTTDIQGSGITIDDSDNISGVGTLNTHTIPGGTGTFALTSDLSTYLENVVEDTTPQLGGNLDVNGNSIVSVGAVDINISPATGRSVLVNTADFQVKNSTSISHRLVHNNTSYLGNGTGGIRRIGFAQVTSPTASIHIGAGSTAASSAPIKLTAGTNMTTPEAGAIEYDGTDLFFTDGTATRRTILNNSDIGSSVQAYDADLAGIASLTINANDLIVGDGANSFTTTTITTFGKSLIDDANASTARSTLGLAIGTDVQAQDAFLQNIADLTDPNADRLLFWDDSAGAITWLTAGSGLTISGTTISASGSGVTFGADNQIPFTNATTDDFDYSANLTYDGTDLIVGGVDVLTETNTKTTTNKTLGTGTVFSASPTINSGVKFNFIANTTAGLNVGAIGGAPSSLVDGDIWYNSDLNVFQGRLNTSSRTFAMLSNKLSEFASTTSAELASVISDETGSGALVFANSPTLGGSLTIPSSITMGANTFARSGIHNLTLTTTGTTNATFPSGTTTLVDTNSTSALNFGGATSLEIPNGAGGTTVDAAGEVTVDTTSGTLNFHDGTAEVVLNPIETKTFGAENPGASEDFPHFHYTKVAITITEIEAVLVGSSSPSVTWTLRHSTDRSATGNEVVTGGTTTTSTTTGSIVTAFNDATIPANSFLWIETTAQSGTVNSISITTNFRQDA